MVENQNPPREITALDIFKMIKSKIKILALIALIALILGTAGGAAWTIISNATYGSEAEFYIYSENSNSYILSLLRSDSFAERLLLDENGLPSNKKGTEEYNKALAAKEAVEQKLKEIDDLEKKIKLFPTEISNLQRAYSDLQNQYETLNKRLENYMGVQIESIANAEAIVTLEKEIVETGKQKNDAKKAYEDKLLESQNADQLLLNLQEELVELTDERKTAFDVALSDFRKNEENISTIKDIKKSVTFNYQTGEKDNKIDESQSHLYVNIAVKFDKQLAQKLLDSISDKLPSFVEESVIAEGDERETECVFLSVFGSVGSVNYKNPVIEAAKFGAIAMVGAFVVGCCIVVVVDMIKNSAASKAKEEQAALEESSEE